MSGLIFEVCANSIRSAIAAQEGGAHRIELCSELHSGGLTPSAATIKLTLQQLKIPVFVLIRPRAGDFLYSELEFEIMKEDIQYSKSCGAFGVVFGILNSDAKIDVERCSELVNIAKPMQSTFHRAFDRVMVFDSALEDIIKTGAHRILTSGLSEKALNGKNTIKTLVEKSNNRIEIMAGGGINPTNVAEIISYTGVKEIHASCSVYLNTKMARMNKFTTSELTYKNTVTDVALVKKMKEEIEKK